MTTIAIYICPACGGDGIETCNNPDHGFIEAMPGEINRLGCPCCGHDPNFKMKGPCPECKGTGKVTEEEAIRISDEYQIDEPYEPITSES